MNKKTKANNQNSGNLERHEQLAERQDVKLFIDMFTTINALPTDTRAEINRLCDWSVPTFYRKLNGKDRKGVSLAQLLSIADVYIQNVDRLKEALKYIKTNLERLKKL